jgi:uncharacterized RDD family membrane protein YckC
MTRIRVTFAALLATFVVAAAARPGAQIIRVEIDDWGNPALRIGQNYTLREGATARQAVVIAGDATIDGRVDRDVVVVLGRARLGATAAIDGSLVVVGGTIEAADGARVGQDLVVIGGINAGPGFRSGGQHVVIGTTGLGNRLRGIVPWLTRGLLLGRPIVPDLEWVWMIAFVFFVINLVLNLVFDAPIRASVVPLQATPVSAFMTGVLVLLLFGPVSVLLAVSVIGIAVVPFVLCAVLIGTVLGKIAVARWIGMSIARQDDLADRAQSLRSFLVGSGIVCLLYMVPFVGIITWAVCAVLGLGSATLAFFTAYRRENPKRARAVPAQTAPAAPTPPPAPMPSAGPIAHAAPAAVAPPVTFDPAPPAPVAPPLAFEAAEPAPAMPAAPPIGQGGAATGVPPAAAVGLLAFPRAAFKERFAAFVLDIIVIVILAQILNLDNGPSGVAERLMLILSLAYHVSFWTWKGTTLGGIICQLRVVRTDGGPLKFPEALVRGLTGIFSILVVGLGFLWVIRDPERQSWHDRVAGTYVVKVPRAYPI